MKKDKNYFDMGTTLSIFKFFAFNILLLVGLSGCVSTKNITYFQGDDLADTVRYSTLKTIAPPIVKIQTNDILAVTVSSLSAESNEVFNFPNITPIPTMSFPGVNVSGSRNQPLGYTVNADGMIELPLVGKVKVSELTMEEAANIIKTKLELFLKEPTVSVRILNQKYTILGEVNRPGIYNLNDNQTTIIDALGSAGDLTVFGRRDNVMLIRTEDSKREVVKLDLNHRTVLESPYYYLKSGDFIYVEPTQGKVTSSDRTLQMIPIVTGVATTFVLLMSLIFK